MRGSGTSVIAAGAFLLASLIPLLAVADVVTDGSLGDGSSPTGPGFLITEAMGERPGDGPNLFHSFFEFSLGETQSATFAGPDVVENILGRVTGGSRSEIFGAIRTAPSLGEVDLYLMNPSGMVFGESATLDINGSFRATTADELHFPNGELFEARPGGAVPLLTVAAPEAFGFLSSNSAPISIIGSSLAVSDGASLSLIGAGDVTIDGFVSASVDVGDARSVSIEGDAITIEPGSSVTANASGDGDAGSVSIRGGDIVIEGLVSVDAEGAGSAGTVSIDAESLSIRGAPGSGVRQQPGKSIDEGVGIVAHSLGAGNAGTVSIEVESLSIRGEPSADDSVGTFGVGISADSYGAGNAGTVSIEAESVSIHSEPGFGRSEVLCDECRFAGIFAGGVGDGDGGTITVRADESVVIRGTDVRPVDVFTGLGVSSSGDGSAGRVVVETPVLEIHLDGSISSWALGTGGAGGEIMVEVGKLVLDSGALLREDFASIWTGTKGSGPAGTVAIEAGSVDIRDGGVISATTGGPGDAGTVTVEATDSVFISDAGGDPFSLWGIIAGGTPPTGIYSGTVLGGDSGSITVSAPEITVTEGGIVATSTAGGGDAGDVTLRGERITISAGAFVDSTSLPGGALPGGAAGSVTIEATESIAVEGRSASGHQSRVASATLGPSDAGSVSLRAPLIVVDDAAIATTSVASPFGESGGRAGEIVLEAEELRVTGGGRVDSSSMTAGEAGSIRVVASELLLVEGAGSGIASRTGGQGLGGDVVLRAPQIEVSDGGEVSAESSAGLQETRDIFGSFYDEKPKLIADPDPVATGNAGSVTLEANQVLVQSGSIATHSEAADGGDVTIFATEMLHLIDGEITASVSSGSGGNIAIDPVFVILEGESRIVAQATTGSGGNISITTDALLASQESVISASSQLGVQGTVEIHSPETDVAGTLASLPETFLEAAALMKERCAARKGGESSGSFVWTGRQGVSWSPDGMIPASYREAEERPEPEPVGLVLGTSPTTGEQLAFLIGCGGQAAVSGGRGVAEVAIRAR